jgi:hypothetical protein
MKNTGSVRVWWLLRAYRRRNPLVRTSDRVELFFVTVAFLVALVATACAGALGTAVHDARSHVYLAEAQARHTVIGTADKGGTTVLGFDRKPVTGVNVRWHVDGVEYTDHLTIRGSVKTGDPVTIWLDKNGNRVDEPTPPSQAGVDAVIASLFVWQFVVLTVTGLMCLARAGFNRRRMHGWDRDLRSLVHDGGSGNRKS